MSATVATASSAISTLYRIAVYLFLEAVRFRPSLLAHRPHSHYSYSPQVPKNELKYIIPSLYLLYLATSYCSAPLFNETVVVKEEVAVIQEENKVEKNGDIVTDVALVQATSVTPVRESFNVSNTPLAHLVTSLNSLHMMR